ncbi:MAG: hypothetical protein A2Y62_20200 [Candidatus Fischerbacteria bacterium RBG_13_37_8]|uniref:Uncharacterized protein n=1 Tax=Candidatus Fischerbacteria bacterium RBG_13_37_8 TaxID=1817863 RepID=A0A1F5VFP5_9BACT|nr:MAG: hypothetical protein A2Y62_20200 [Candidatus Fischerbacteria bacterium RBG_13_37_8]
MNTSAIANYRQNRFRPSKSGIIPDDIFNTLKNRKITNISYFHCQFCKASSNTFSNNYAVKPAPAPDYRNKLFRVLPGEPLFISSALPVLKKEQSSG